MLKNYVTETQCKNRASLPKFLSCLRYLARQGLPFRGYENDKESNIKQLSDFRCEDDLAFAEWLKKKE